MELLEKDLEDLIYSMSNKSLAERGLPVRGKAKRQLNIGNYGIADLVYFRHYTEENFVYSTRELFLDIDVIELKKDKIGVDAFLQALRYCKGISRYLELRSPDINCFFNIKLIGSDVVRSSDILFLTDLMPGRGRNGFIGTIISVEFYTYDYRWDGLWFNNMSGFVKKDEGFNLSYGA